MKRPQKTFEIALSGIACAFATLALTVGSYVDWFVAAGYLLAIFSLMVPLSQRFIWGNALAFLGAVLFAFLFSGLGILRLLPFIAFFGLHPLVNFLQMQFVKKKPLHALCFLVKAVWFDLAMWLAWVVFVPVFGLESATWYPFVAQYFFLVLFIGGTLFFAAYDYMIILCQRSVNTVVRRIRR